MEEAQYYISLQEATHQCSYTQEYLSLRARQGKLKARKLGRNWFTTKDWLNEYVQGATDFNVEMEEKRSLTRPAVFSAPPVNLPTDASVYETDFSKQKKTKDSRSFIPNFSFAKLELAFASFVLLLVATTLGILSLEQSGKGREAILESPRHAIGAIGT